MSSTRGPIPKRDAERAGHNAARERADKVVAPYVVAMPPVPDEWLPRARDWYLSLKASGQSRYYEPSDWQLALATGDMLDKLLRAEEPSAAMFKTIIAAMDDLGVSEGARRRQRIEVERPGQDPGGDPAASDLARDALSEQFERLRVVHES